MAFVSNERPLRGEDLKVTYRPDSTSTLSIDDEIYTRYWIYNEDFSIIEGFKKMVKVGSSHTTSITVGAKASLYKFSFENDEVGDFRNGFLIKPGV